MLSETDPMWDLERSLVIVRALQPVVRDFNYHLTIGGGVVNKGQSNKDLDLYFLPMGGFDVSKKKPQSDKLLKYLSKMWGEPDPIAKTYGYGQSTTSFYKHAVQFIRWGGLDRKIRQRIDCFIF